MPALGPTSRPATKERFIETMHSLPARIGAKGGLASFGQLSL